MNTGVKLRDDSEGQKRVKISEVERIAGENVDLRAC